MKLWKKIVLALAALVVLAIIVGGAGIWLLTKYAARFNPAASMNEPQLQAAIARDPKDPGPHRSLGQYYTLRSIRAGTVGEKLELYRKSYGEYRAANGLATNSLRSGLMKDLAWAAWRAGDKAAAGRYAKVMVKDAVNDWNLGNNHHHGHTILGLLAVGRGDMRTARSELGLSGAVSGTPQLKSFGPQMMLAKALLEKGDREAVVNYFAACGKFWKMDWGKLKKWTRQVRAGEIPDFGGNLIL